MNERFLFRIPIFYNGKLLGFEYHNIETGQVLTDIKDKTNCKNWQFGDWEQCMAFRDKNNTLIYEGDIVRMVDPENETMEPFEAVATWDKDLCRFYFKRISKSVLAPERIDVYFYCMEYSEIVGSTHNCNNLTCK